MSNTPSVLGVIERIASPDITVNQERCVVVRNRNSSCRTCADACTSGAISCVGDELVVDPSLCIGCGTCATVCPTCALDVCNPNDAELFARALEAAQATDGRPVIACSQYLSTCHGAYARKGVIEVGCVGRIEETFLCGLIANGVRSVTLMDSLCPVCPHRSGNVVAHVTSDTAISLLSACGLHDVDIGFAEQFPEHVKLCGMDGGSVQKSPWRGCARQTKEGLRSTLQVAATTMDKTAPSHGAEAPEGEAPRYLHVMEDGTLAHFIPTRRERLLDWLSLLGYPERSAMATRLWGSIEIDAKACSSCRMCATFCPTGAIVKFDDDDGTFGIEHYPADCVHCGLCRDICPTGAIVLTNEVPAIALDQGLSYRHEMDPIIASPNRPKSIYDKMYPLLGGGQVFER